MMDTRLLLKAVDTIKQVKLLAAEERKPAIFMAAHEAIEHIYTAMMWPTPEAGCTCDKFFASFKCNKPEDCDCPRCQGYCECKYK